MSITVFKNLYDSKPFYTSTTTVLSSIKAGPKQLNLLNQIRATVDKDQKNELKKQLSVICFGGKFKERKISGLISFSRQVILDFDNVNAKLKKKELAAISYIAAAWVSPSGDGVKALVNVSSDNHLGHFKALCKEIPGVDASGKDVCRACFMSYDPDMYLNENSDLYTKIIEEAYTDDQKLEKLKTWLANKGEQFVSGNRNNFIAKLAGACNRFGLSQMFSESALVRDYVSGSDFSQREAVAVIRSIYANYADQHATVSFDEPISETRTKEILSDKLVTRDVIYLQDVETDLINDYENGTPGAPSTHFMSIDTIFRPVPGDLNVMSGIGNFGKSAFKKQMDLVRSVKDGHVHCFFSPEEVPPLFWYRELVRSYIGKPLEKGERDRMTMEEYRRGMEFVREHFIFVYPPTLPTPDYILERFAEVIIKNGANSVTLDPWNQLLHLMEKRDDIYLGETLSKFERFAQQHNIYFTVICHPNRTTKDAAGNYVCPDVYDLNGGPTWNARATNICVYHRPYYGVDKSDPTCEFHSKKIKKQMISGLPGMVTLDYDRKRGRFYESGYSPLDN